MGKQGGAAPFLEVNHSPKGDSCGTVRLRSIITLNLLGKCKVTQAVYLFALYKETVWELYAGKCKRKNKRILFHLEQSA